MVPESRILSVIMTLGVQEGNMFTNKHKPLFRSCPLWVGDRQLRAEGLRCRRPTRGGRGLELWVINFEIQECFPNFLNGLGVVGSCAAGFVQLGFGKES